MIATNSVVNWGHAGACKRIVEGDIATVDRSRVQCMCDFLYLIFFFKS